MTAQSPPFALQNAQHSAALFRQAVFSAWRDASGVVGPGDFAVTAQGTPNMSVLVAAGRAWMKGTQVASVSGGTWSPQAGYFGINDAPVTLTITAADPTNPRIDLVVAYTQDAFYSGSTNALTLGVVTGTPASTPAAPAAPNNALVLATVAVAANATQITSGNISQASALLALPRGGLLTCTSSTRPGSPGTSQEIYETDTGRRYIWTGSAWQYAGSNPPPIAAVTVLTGWTALAGQAPGVYKDAAGLVHLVGAITNNSTYNPNGANAAAQLPAGFWPSVLTVLQITSGAQPFTIQISTAGVLSITGSPVTSAGAGTGHWLVSAPAFHPGYAGSVPLA